MAADGPVPPGTGWPGDPAAAATPVAHDAAEVRALAAEAGTLAELVARQSVCRACPRLVEWREQVTIVKRPSSRAANGTGAVPSPAGAMSGLAVLVAYFARPPTAATGPAGSSPVTAAAMSCSRRCTGAGWPPSRHRSRLTTASG